VNWDFIWLISSDIGIILNLIHRSSSGEGCRGLVERGRGRRISTWDGGEVNPQVVKCLAKSFHCRNTERTCLG
jgi:hypothetical protein